MKYSRPLSLFASFASVGLAGAGAQITTVFNDTFDTYADGKADTAYVANYNFPATVGALTIATGTGLGGSKSLQNTADGTLVRDITSSAINYTSADNNRFATVSVYFQHGGSFGTSAPQIGLTSTGTGGFTGGTGVFDISGRITTGGKLELRSNNASVLTDTNALTLTTNSWYFLQYSVERATTTDTFTATVSLFNSSTTGVVGTLVDSISATFTNTGMWSDTQVFAALRENTSILNLDNFSLTQGISSSIPEPSSFAALAGLCVLGAVAVRRTRP